MLQRVRDFFNAYLLIELWQGLRVTLTQHVPAARSPFSFPRKRRR